MRNTAKTKFTELLKKYKIYDEFKKKLHDYRFSYDSYCLYVEALYAFRRIFNYNDDSVLGRAAKEWDDIVIVNRYSHSLESHITKWGMQLTIKHIHHLQSIDYWPVPHGVDDFQLKKKNLHDALGSVDTGEEPSQVAPKVAQTSAKPQLPDTTPLPTPKATPSFLSSSDNFEFLSFSQRSGGKQLDLDDYHIRIINDKSKKSYEMTFNKYISDLILNEGLKYMRIRLDKITGRKFLVFSTVNEEGSLLCRTQHSGRTASRFHITCKPLVEYISASYVKSEKEYQLRVTKNQAHVSNILTVEIIPE